MSVAVAFEPKIDLLPGELALVAEYFHDRVELTGTLSIDGSVMRVLLTKPVGARRRSGDGPTLF